MIEISREENLRTYLEKSDMLDGDRPVSIHYFSGGVSGATALVRLASGRELIVKQAYARLNVAAVWECNPERIRMEHEALKIYNEIVPDCVPKPIAYDSTNYVMIREAVPESWVMWKSELLNGRLQDAIAEKAAAALAEVHNRTAGNEQIREVFGDPSVFYTLRVEPYIEYPVGRYPEIREQSRVLADKLMTEQIALIHGDYSPKNILVHDDQICILDMEVAYYGHPCFDLAFLTNHFLLKAVFRKELADRYLNMMLKMVQLYFDRENFTDRKKLEADTVRTLAFLFLARVDGKSPVEYLKEEVDRNLVRAAAMEMIRKEYESYDEITACLKRHLSGAEKGDEKAE